MHLNGELTDRSHKVRDFLSPSVQASEFKCMLAFVWDAHNNNKKNLNKKTEFITGPGLAMTH